MKKVLLVIIFISIPSYAALVKFGGVIYMPNLAKAVSGAPNLGTVAIDAVGEKMAQQFFVEKSVKVKSIGAALSTVTGGTMQVRIETMNLNTGSPSGDYACSGSSASVTLVNTDDTVVVFSSDLTGGTCTLNPGSFYTVVWEHVAAPLDITFHNFQDEEYDFPVRVSSNSTSGWSKSTTHVNFAFKLEDDSFYVPPSQNAYADINTINISAVSATNELGVLGNFDFGFYSPGAWVWVQPNRHFYVKLWEKGVVVATSTVISTTTLTGAVRIGFFQWDNGEYYVKPNINYRLTVRCAEPATITLYEIAYISEALKAADTFGRHFQTTLASNPTNEGSFTNRPDTTMFMGFAVSSMDIGTGGSYSAGH